ncbi:MAG: methyltransferase domain-containing protein [Acidobacteria bacterium]|nr:MAG: methyltransferase domain-containing protein [Acidobacteriota bacterium]
MKALPIVRGLLSYVPGFERWRSRGTGGSDSARYCYAVWMRHLVKAAESGLDTSPRTVAELGPGDSLGLGLAALLSGARRFVALDVIEHAATETNLRVLAELERLFAQRSPIPDDREFPEIGPDLDSYEFPHHLLSDERLAQSLEERRVAQIRDSTARPQRGESMIRYVAGWSDRAILEEASVDMLCSQAVLEHVQDLSGVYRAIARWLRPGGFASHQIDLRSHGLSADWNGHWAISRPVWRLIVGRRRYLLNRAPCSVHLDHIRGSGLIPRSVVRQHRVSAVRRRQLAAPYRGISDEDLETSGLFVQAQRPVDQ